MGRAYKSIPNSPITHLSFDIDSVQTTIEVADGAKLPAAPNLCTIFTKDKEPETILYTQKVDNLLYDVERGFQGEASSWSSGSTVSRVYTAHDHDTFVDLVNSRGEPKGYAPLDDNSKIPDEYIQVIDGGEAEF